MNTQETGMYFGRKFLANECGLTGITFRKVVVDDGFGHQVAKIVVEGTPVVGNGQLVSCWLNPIKGMTAEDIEMMPTEVSDIVLFFPQHVDEETGETYVAQDPTYVRFVGKDGEVHFLNGGKRRWDAEASKYEYPSQAEEA